MNSETGLRLATWQLRVKEWQKRLPLDAAAGAFPNSPKPLDANARLVRGALMLEELREFMVSRRGPHEHAAELADLLFLVLGTFNLMGVDAECALAAVARANRAKIQGGVRLDSSGRICKPDGWQSPEVGLQASGLHPVPVCPGIEVEPGVFSGCVPLADGTRDCPVCCPGGSSGKPSDPQVGTALERITTARKFVDAIYSMLIQTKLHGLVEFNGFMQKYLDICELAARAGIDFDHANVHGDAVMPVQRHDMRYLAEKFSCIFSGLMPAGSQAEHWFLQEAFPHLRPKESPTPEEEAWLFDMRRKFDRLEVLCAVCGKENYPQPVCNERVPLRNQIDDELAARFAPELGPIDDDGRAPRATWAEIMRLREGHVKLLKENIALKDEVARLNALKGGGHAKP